MRSSELEQRINEINFRLSKMDEKIKNLEEENEKLISKFSEVDVDNNQQQERTSSGSSVDYDEKISSLSNEIYKFIERQNKELASYIDENRSYHEKKLKDLSDELYEYIGKREKIIREYINDKM